MSFFSKNKIMRKKISYEKIRKELTINMPRILLAFFVFFSLWVGFFILNTKKSGLNNEYIPDVRIGDISPATVIAHYDFSVPKSEDQLSSELKQASEKIIPYFQYNTGALSEIKIRVDSVFTEIVTILESSNSEGISSGNNIDVTENDNPSSIKRFSEILKNKNVGFSSDLKKNISIVAAELYQNLIVSQKDLYQNITKDKMFLEYPDTLRESSFENILCIDRAKEIFNEKLSDLTKKALSENERQLIVNIFSDIIIPNISFDRQRTEKSKNELIDKISKNIASYKKNERIIEANVPVNELNVLSLKTYKELIENRSEHNKKLNYLADSFGDTLTVICIVSVFMYYLKFYRKKLFDSFSVLVLMTIIFSIPVFASFYSAYTGYLSPYLIPVALSAILASILIETETGLWLTLVICFTVAAIQKENGMTLILINFIAGSIGILSLGKVRKRKEFYRSMLIMPVVMCLLLFVTRNWSSIDSLTIKNMDYIALAFNGFFCPVIAIGLLPILETTFKTVTDITLLELSDMNNPLLKELSVKAPGTFSASIMVGTLAETAAEKVGANSLLARVGSYYHDIGKLSIPEYYIENQKGGENPHNKLNPNMSAIVIISHVKEGYELSKKHGLPEPISNIILQHHGTSVIASIFNKAIEEGTHKQNDEHHFRYPGPKPQTKEAGIVMLADLVEAASRTIDDRSPKKLRMLIHTIIQKRFAEGELDECELTLRDIHAIEESFLPILISSHHSRIIYPWQKLDKRFVSLYKDNLIKRG